MQGGESVRTADRKKKAAEIERLHEKTFRAWANSQLRVRNIKIENSLQEAFHDGLMLIQLVEVLSKEKCTEKYHKNPEKDIHKLENITIAINFLKKFVNVNISSNDILQGNLKVILGVVWRLILTFQVEGQETDETKDMSAAQRNKLAKQKLLKWCQDTTAGHKHVNIQDFQDSWFDGMAFCALVHAMDPSLIDYDSLDPSNTRANLALAFSLAEKHFDIPQLLDPDDICNPDEASRPDEQCFITYLSAFPVAMLQKKIGQADDNEAKLKAAEEEARRKAEEEAARKIKEAEEAARRKAEEEAARKAAELDAKLRAEEEERRRREADRLKDAEARAAADAKAKAEAKAKKKEMRRAKEEEERKRLAELDEAKRLAEEEAREKAFEDERKRLEEENRRLKESLLAAKAKLIGKLKVTVLQARNLPNSSHPYCTLFLERQKERTRTLPRKAKELKWNAEFEFYVSERDAALELTVFHRNWLFSDDFLGYVSIPVSGLPDGKEVTDWHELQSRKKKKGKSKEGDKPQGEIKLTLLYNLEN